MAVSSKSRDARHIVLAVLLGVLAVYLAGYLELRRRRLVDFADGATMPVGGTPGYHASFTSGTGSWADARGFVFKPMMLAEQLVRERTDLLTGDTAKRDAEASLVRHSALKQPKPAQREPRLTESR